MANKFWVFDTNTLLSALLNEDSTPGIALKKARQTGILLISAQITKEYFSVFSRSKFDKYISLELRIAFIENIISNSLVVEVKEQIFICRDPNDNKFLDLAIITGADCIISGDQDLLVLHPINNIPILSSADFLNRFDFQ